MIAAAPSVRGESGEEAGFTLVELLAALSLLSLLSAALFGSLRFGFNAWERGTDRAERVHNSMLAQDLLRRVIADAYPFFLSADPTRGRIDFDGTATSLSFLATTPIALGSAGRARFVLSVDRHRGRSVLAMTAKPELASRENSSTLTRRTLIANLEAAEFSYFGGTRSDKIERWHDKWIGETTLPRLVRVRARFPAGDSRLWPDLLIAPRLGADVACIYDPLTKVCRGR